MVRKNKHRIIAALDTGNLEEAIQTVKRLSPYCGAFKVGHALTLPNGLAVVDQLQDAGAERIFLDLKFHDIPNSVGIAVREAARHNVWMLTLHLSGGAAMLSAAAAEAQFYSVDQRPLLIGVSVLTSIDQKMLSGDLGVDRDLKDHMLKLSELGMRSGLDGIVCSVEEAADIKAWMPEAVVVTPGIRAAAGDRHDQSRVGDGQNAIDAGADYLVIGRALTKAEDPEAALASLRLAEND